jgi:antitoxin component YwqK of YwqJK toxin-antitoxin module
MKSLSIIILILNPFFLSAQCITKKNMEYVIGDSLVKVYPDNSNLFNRVDTLAGLLTWNLDPCARYKIFTDNKKKNCITEYYFNEDTIVAIHYYLNGRIRLIDKEVSKKRLYIYTATYYDNGQLLYSDNPNSLEARTITQYHSNGKIKRQFLLWGISCWGTSKSWYPSGKIESSEEFSPLTDEAEKNYSESERIGTWQYWDEKGKLIKRITYEKNKITKEEVF